MLEFHEMPGHLIRRLHQISVSLFADRVGRARFDLTPVQYAALSAINGYPAIDQATLAGVIAYDRVTIGGVVDRLVQKGFVLRKINSRDRRARELFVTPKGQIVLNDIAPVVRKVQGLILSGLDKEERQTLVRLLRKATQARNSSSRAPLRMME